MDIAVQKRFDFTIKLLTELRNTNYSLKELNSTIESTSESFHRKVFDQNRSEVKKDIEIYNANIEKICLLNNRIISSINEWFNFINSPNEIKKIIYPLRLLHKKKKLKSLIKTTNTEISNTLIENRFIKEHLSSWEHELELKAIDLISSGEEHKLYIQLVNRKDELVSELKYLLPTICDSKTLELNLDDIDKLIEELSKMTA